MINTDPTKNTRHKTKKMSNMGHTKNTTQKTKKMSNMDPNKNLVLLIYTVKSGKSFLSEK